MGVVLLVTRDWDTFKKEAATYIERARVFYSIREEGRYISVKIAVGRIGFEGEFDKEKDKEAVDEVLQWLAVNEGFRVDRAVNEDIFFSEA